MGVAATSLPWLWIRFAAGGPPPAVRRSDSWAGSATRPAAILVASDDLHLSVGGKRLPARV
jgi:hypothetical protein